MMLDYTPLASKKDLRAKRSTFGIPEHRTRLRELGPLQKLLSIGEASHMPRIGSVCLTGQPAHGLTSNDSISPNACVLLP